MATGGTITTDGDWKIHRFNSNANFVADAQITDARIMLQGGGGGGAGGGGAGGMHREYTGITITPGTYAIVRGGYGAGNGSKTGRGGTGGSSTGLGYTSTGGGGGGRNYSSNGGSSQDGGPGGNGGGGGAWYSSAHRSYPGVGTDYNGGDNQNLYSATGAGAGSGSRSGVYPASSSNSGNGGAGTSTDILLPATETSAYYGGGGGGGNYYYYNTNAGGAGGGGAGKGYYQGNGTAGTHYLGGGGGGCGLSYTGGRGGYGTVIIAYDTNNEGDESGHMWMSLNFAIIAAVTLPALKLLQYADLLYRGILPGIRNWLFENLYYRWERKFYRKYPAHHLRALIRQGAIG